MVNLLLNPLVRKVLIGVVVAVALFFVARYVVNYIEGSAENKVIIETIEKESTTRKEVTDAVRTAPRTVDDALEFLRDRQGR